MTMTFMLDTETTGLNVDDGDPCTFCCEEKRRFPADPTGATGDKGNLVLESHRAFLPSKRWFRLQSSGLAAAISAPKMRC